MLNTAIFRKELKSYFITPSGYIFAGLFFMIAGIVFVSYNISGSRSDINGMLGILNFVTVLIFPVLTMKLFAEEKRSGTDKLIFTSGIGFASIVIGKYLAALVVFITALVLTGFFPAVLIILGKSSVGAIIGSYTGFIFLGAAYIAVCVFASSLTDSQITSAILGLGILLLLLILGFFSNHLIFPVLKDSANWLSLSYRYEEFTAGILKAEPFVYYSSYIVFFLVMTVFVLKEKSSGAGTFFGFIINKKAGSFFHNINLSVKIIIFLAIIAAANAVSSRLPFSYDMTMDRIFTLSEKSVGVIMNLDKKVEIVIFTKNTSNDRMTENLLKKYSDSSKGKISYKFVDADKNPLEAKNYDLNNEGISNGMIVIESGGKIKKIHDFDIIKTDGSGIGQTFSAEQQFTGAIINLTTDVKRNIYFLEGHGELDPQNDLFKLKYKLESESYSVEKINLLSAGQIPHDADVIVVASPKNDLNSLELPVLKNYLERGGRMMFCFDVLKPGTDISRFNILLKDYGVGIKNNFIIEETEENYYSGNKMFVLPVNTGHPIAAKIKSAGMFILMPFPGNIELDGNIRDGLKVEPVLITSDKSWIRYNLNNTSFVKSGSDKNGPALIALAITKDNSDQKYKETKINVTYNARFILDSLLEIQGNYDYFAGSVSWIEGKKDDIAIRPKIIEANSFILNGTQMIVFTLLSILVIPVLIFASGFAVWFGRKNK
jgi:ABC-2 type transport system permease protein